MMHPLRRDDYTVGWVCALDVELAAAQEMLDEEHPKLERDPADNDENLYTFGSMSGHNVVIVSLPAGRIGNNPATAVAAQMRATFKKIRFGLMVGVGGGVPSAEADVRLGDVVVCVPAKVFGGVVQYDVGKTTASGFERTGSLDSPPQVLLAAVKQVKANELRNISKLDEHITKLERLTAFKRCKAGPDILFEAASRHEGGQTCDKCNSNQHKAREPRNSGEEVVTHHGTIASGNQVIKDATVRDKLSAELGGVLCFEMEAAGLMNSFPCLVVRGVCDYADSHKNERWQAYAAGTAAAYAKEVLRVIPSTAVDKTPALDKIMNQRTTKRRLDNDSTRKSSKRARLSRRKGKFDDLGHDEDNRTSSEDDENGGSGDDESGSSGDDESESSGNNQSESSEDNDSVSSGDTDSVSSGDTDSVSSGDDESGSSGANDSENSRVDEQTDSESESESQWQ
ncbi:hypothetical protein E8E13_006245 [Curvularia kusanoi]|uniref:Nucleoside phosphorylase domain-containing protein n=1 Tax=Curvularia kusanoi TaxID=90978 RepID=A0A9P4WA07_CURKU|nr:hypothetical protein E8E13_006245 [Curvularia kusanoi]